MTDEMWGKEMLRGSSHLGSGEQGGMVLGSIEWIPGGQDPRQKQVRGSLDPSEQLLLPEGAALAKGRLPRGQQTSQELGTTRRGGAAGGAEGRGGPMKSKQPHDGEHQGDGHWGVREGGEQTAGATERDPSFPKTQTRKQAAEAGCSRE